jgi:hypothetical protein
MGYIMCGYYLVKFIRKQLISLNPYIQLIVLAFFYAIIFGIGIAGGGGEPGFAFPVPVILAGILQISIWALVRIFINGVIIPLFFWWIVIFIVMLIRDKIKRRKLSMSS